MDTHNQTSEKTSEKIVRTVREFCQTNRETGAWPSSEHAVRAIIQQGEDSPFAEAFLRYNRRILIDQVAWDACLVRLSQQPTIQIPMRRKNEKKASNKPHSDQSQHSEERLCRLRMAKKAPQPVL